MKKTHALALMAFIFIILSSFIAGSNEFKKFIEPSPQRTGNSERGYDYLVNGDYVSSGIPYDLFTLFGPIDSSNILGRSGEAALLPPQFNYVKNSNGTAIAAPNCLSCHGEYLNGQFIVGLGNNTFDYRYNIQGVSGIMSAMVANRYGMDSKEYKGFEPFQKASAALSGHLKTKARGVNPADKLTAVLIAHRHPKTLEWSDSTLLDVPDITIPTDVPPWWHLKKKNAMFYTGIGRGDFSRFLMASSILTLKDSAQARKIDERFPDVLAWINDLEAPKYPGTIDRRLASEGELIFNKNCSGCHGSYGKEESYPNLLISLDKIGTDKALSRAYTDSLYRNFIDWYNNSWFIEGEHPGKLVIEEGYVAPPLDGIWATAPYLHNGSVPTVEDVLNSRSRPDFWQRSFDSSDYDYDKLGWHYIEKDSTGQDLGYNTRIPAYGNMGHTFGDNLSEYERKAVIEYLKTL